MATDETTKATEVASGKKLAPFFAAVRDRGLLNSMLNGPALLVEEKYPDKKAHWEYWPANGDNTMIVAREGMGYELVDASEIVATESSTSKGIVRRGDLVLMKVDKEIWEAVREQDEKAAKADRDLPVTTYEESLRANKVRLSSGETDYAKPVVQPVKVSLEPVGIPESALGG